MNMSIFRRIVVLSQSNRTHRPIVISITFVVVELEMYDEIFHIEICKNFMKILKYFMKFLIFIIT